VYVAWRSEEKKIVGDPGKKIYLERITVIEDKSKTKIIHTLNSLYAMDRTKINRFSFPDKVKDIYNL
jgi:hypothetical protein